MTKSTKITFSCPICDYQTTREPRTDAEGKYVCPACQNGAPHSWNATNTETRSKE